MKLAPRARAAVVVGVAVVLIEIAAVGVVAVLAGKPFRPGRSVSAKEIPLDIEEFCS